MSKIKHFKANQGYSLFELITIVAVIGILAAIALVNYSWVLSKPTTAEAKMIVRDLQGLATIYYEEHGVAPTLAQLNDTISVDITNEYAIITPGQSGIGAQRFIICSTMDLKDVGYIYGLDEQPPLVADIGSDPVSGGFCGPAGTNNGNSATCDIESACPCNGDWRNHGQYISCVTKAAQSCVAANIITGDQIGSLVSQAAQSSCGE